MKMRHALFTSTLALLLTGCQIGPSAESFRPARQAAGIEVRARHDSGVLEGELLTPQDSGLLVISRERVIFFIGYGELRGADFDQLGVTRWRGRTPSEGDLERLRRASRYPQGVSPELLERLLAAYEQAEVRRLPPEQGDGGHSAATSTDLLDRARAATLRYQDRNLAIAEGYRRIGPDFPGMGEHWVNLGRLMSGVLEAERPQILSYVTIEGRPRLVGVAYAAPIAPGESAPTFPGGPASWHYHARTVLEESFLPHHPPESSASDAGTRIAVVHAWVHLENPAGVFATENWSLPFLRAGLEPPREARPTAARALSLVGGGDGFYLEAIATSVALDDHTREQVEVVLERSRARVHDVLGSRIASKELRKADLGELSAVWVDFWRSVHDVLGADEEWRLSHLSGTMR